MKIALKYILFAAIASSCNLALQYVSLRTYTGAFALYPAMAVGTFAGLVVKFVLDKNYIFYHTSAKTKEMSWTFILYSLTGVGTTLLFWAIEVSFDALLRRQEAKYIGAAIGLSIGYWIKYHLDKRMVFTNNADSGTTSLTSGGGVQGQ
jgi:putative flippase GtrA